VNSGIEERAGLPRAFDYELCDVFTDQPFRGNQLAIFDDAGALSDEEMQMLARETNLSETTFIVRRDAEVERREGVRVRIFTTQEELPFAGHPTLGTAALVRRNFPHFQGASEVVLDLKAGKVPVRFSASEGASVYGEMTQPDPVFGKQQSDREALAAALGLQADDLSQEWTAQTVSTGMPFLVVPLHSVSALEKLGVPQRAAAAYLAEAGAKFFYCVARAEDGSWRARMQFYGGEDPATGSAAGCAIAWMVAQGIVSSGERVHLRQGVEMLRSSDLFLRASRESGRVSEVRVGGSTVPVAKGRFFLERFT
jgi:trans-2,3-dihydro-3-hydroxyanthranilate isomerase